MKRFWPVFFILVRIALGVIFIAAAAPKIWRPDEFADAINNYRILPYFLVNVSAITLPWVEMLFGLFLVFGFRTKAASLATSLLMMMFLAALISAYARHINIDCGCQIPLLSSRGAGIGWREFLRDTIFLAMSLFVYLRRRPASVVPHIG